MSALKKIGSVGISYNHRYNFAHASFCGYSYIRSYDLLTPYRFLMRFPLLKKMFASTKLKNLFIDIGLTKVERYHFFNTLAITKKNWVVTFETALPRWGNDKFGVKLIAKENCTALVAMSECARKIHLSKIKSHFPEYYEVIEKKTVVLHPFIEAAIGKEELKREINGAVRFCFVGNDFFRKGGREVITVFENILKKYSHAELVIVSSFKYGDYASRTNEQQAADAKEKIKAMGGRVTVYENIPHRQVFEIIKTCDVGLLPTYADTYGYSVLEFQAHGCPVITTDIRALPEINNDEVGWMISVKKNELNEAYYKTEADRQMLTDTIIYQLNKIVESIMAFPLGVRVKGEAALGKIIADNNRDKRCKALQKIYNGQLQSIIN